MKLSRILLPIAFFGMYLSACFAAGPIYGPVQAQNNGTDFASPSTTLVNLGGISSANIASTYLTQSNAASTYLTITTAGTTYETQTAAALLAPLASPTFTGTASAPTAAPGTNSTKIANTAFVTAADAFLAPLASPTFSGTATVPNPATGTNTTQVANTAFVQNTFAAPPALGSTTPAAITGTTVTANTSFSGPGTGLTGVPFTALPSVAANVTLGSLTASTPTTLTMPSCSTGISALTWTTGFGFGCNSISGTYTPSAVAITGGSINGTTVGATTPSTGQFSTLTATGTFTPLGGIQSAATAGTAAAAGFIGQVLTGSTSGTSLTSGTSAAIASVSLTAGDWDVSSTGQSDPAATTVMTSFNVATNTSTSLPASIAAGGYSTWNGTVTGLQQIISASVFQYNVSTTTTVNCVGAANFSVSTLTASGFIRARRVR